MNLSRRAMLAASGLATVAGAARADAPAPAVVVSTWDFGAAANAEAVRVRIAGGSGLDMVEAGAKVPEADPNNHSVG